MAADYQLNFQDYLSIARRWSVAMLLAFGATLAASVMVALVVPRVYESTATIVVEAPQISSEVVQSTVTGAAAERIQSIQQRIMTRENLLRIAQDHGLFVPANNAQVRESDVVNLMRGSIRVEQMSTTSNDWQRPATTFAFNLSFQYGDPAKALEVTQELIKLFLSGNTQERVGRATRTTEFLTQEADKLRQQLEDLERQIAAYKLRNASALPENQSSSASSIQRLETELRETERQQRTALDELRTLEVDLAAARAGVSLPGVSMVPSPSSTEQELERARAELARIRAIYTDSHPDIRTQTLRVQSLERALAAEASTATPTRSAAAAQAQLTVSRLEARMETARAQANVFGDQQRRLRRDIAQLEADVLRAPQVERGLAALQRDLQGAQAKYEEIRAKQMTAQVAENLEGGQQAESFSVLEPPLLPEYPIKPNRKKMVALGFFLALAAAGGIAFLLETLFARVRGAEAVTAITGKRPMVIVPYIVTATETRQAQVMRTRAIWMAAGAGLVFLAVIHTMITPLHTVLINLFSRLG
jgi:succinoglycan biosynthesis transport protein ExoP